MAKGIPRKTSKATEPSKEVPMSKTVVPKFVGKSLGSYEVPVRSRLGYGIGVQSAAFRYPILMEEPLPYQYGKGSITVNEAILLCQKAWCKVPAFANCVNTMTELCNTEIFLSGGNAQSKSFFEAWLKRINIWKLKNQFFLELFRSGNVFMYRVDGSLSRDDAKKMQQVYGKNNISKDVEIPLRYIMLNPANIALYGDSLNFENPIYFRILNKFEIDVLRTSQNPDDQDLFKNLPDSIKSYFDGEAASKPVPLDPAYLHSVFYKKQDYEPFAIPMGYPVLDSIELKLSLQRADAVVARAVEHIILLVTMGAKREDGGVNPESLRLLQQAFQSEEVGRVLVSDYTTQAEFVIPDLNKVLGDAKYAVVNRDISDGLFNIMASGPDSKSTHMLGKLKVFCEKLNNAQEMFINDFLMPEIKRVSKIMGFKSFPVPEFVKVDLDDRTNMMRIYAQLMQLGILTPKDGMDALEKNVLPDYDDLHDNQLALKKDKDKGLFQPLQGGPWSQIQIAEIGVKSASDLQDQSQEGQMDLQKNAQQHDMDMQKQNNQHQVKTTKMTLDHQAAHPQPVAPQIHVNAQPAPKQMSGRPPGGGTKQVNKRPAKANENFSMGKLIENTKTHSKLIEQVTTDYKRINKVKKLDESDAANINALVRSITENEEPAKWLEKSENYVTTPNPPNEEVMLAIAEIAAEYGVSNEAATLLYHSFKEEEVQVEVSEETPKE